MVQVDELKSVVVEEDGADDVVVTEENRREHVGKAGRGVKVEKDLLRSGLHVETCNGV